MEILNYYFNVNVWVLVQQLMEIVGLVVGDVFDFFFGVMVKVVEQVVYCIGNFLLIGNGYYNVQKECQVIEQLICYCCVVLVVYVKMILDEELVGLMKQIFGMVLINCILFGYEICCVVLDDCYGVWLVICYLIQQGYMCIGYLCLNYDIFDVEDWLQGYYVVLEESGLLCNDWLVMFVELDESGGEQVMIELFGCGCYFSVVVCYNDLMVVGVMGVLNDNGIDVLWEILLIGFDDVLILCYVCLWLIIVCYLIVMMVIQVVELVLVLVEQWLVLEIIYLFSLMLVCCYLVVVLQEGDKLQ